MAQAEAIAARNQAETDLTAKRAVLMEVSPDSLALLDAQAALAKSRADAADAAEKAKKDAEAAAAAKAKLEQAIAERDALQEKLDDQMDAADRAKAKGLFAALMQEVKGDPEYPEAGVGEPATATVVMKDGKYVVQVKDAGDDTANPAILPAVVKLAAGDFRMNQENPTQKPFNDVYGAGVLTLGESHATLVKANRFPETGSVTYDPNKRATGVTTGDPTVVSFAGTLQKAPGTFECTGTSCTVPKRRPVTHSPADGRFSPATAPRLASPMPTTPTSVGGPSSARTAPTGSGRSTAAR